MALFVTKICVALTTVILTAVLPVKPAIIAFVRSIYVQVLLVVQVTSATKENASNLVLESPAQQVNIAKKVFVKRTPATIKTVLKVKFVTKATALLINVQISIAEVTAFAFPQPVNAWMPHVPISLVPAVNTVVMVIAIPHHVRHLAPQVKPVLPTHASITTVTSMVVPLVSIVTVVTVHLILAITKNVLRANFAVWVNV